MSLMNLYCIYVLQNSEIHMFSCRYILFVIFEQGLGKSEVSGVSSSMKLVWTKALLLRFRVHYHKMKTRLHRTTPLSWNKIWAITLPLKTVMEASQVRKNIPITSKYISKWSISAWKWNEPSISTFYCWSYQL